MHKVLPALRQAEAAYHQRVPTGALNRAIREAHRPTHLPRASATAPASSTPPRAPTIRPPSRCSRPTSCRPPTCATSSARSARVVRSRPDPDQAPGPPPQRLTGAWRSLYRLLASRGRGSPADTPRRGTRAGVPEWDSEMHVLGRHKVHAERRRLVDRFGDQWRGRLSRRSCSRPCPGCLATAAGAGCRPRRGRDPHSDRARVGVRHHGDGLRLLRQAHGQPHERRRRACRLGGATTSSPTTTCSTWWSRRARG